MSHHTVVGISDATSVLDAFREIADEHHNEYGYSHSVETPWSGNPILTLSPVTRAMGRRIVADAFDRSREREPYIAAPLLVESDLTRRTVKIKVTAKEEDCASGCYIPYEFLEQEARKAVSRPGEFFETFSIVKDSEKITTKVITTTPKEKAVTKYFTVKKGDNPLSQPWSAGHATQALARAAILRWFEDSHSDTQVEYEIVPITRRESGAAMVSIKRVVTKATLEMNVVLVKPAANAQTLGWAVAADCHH